MKKLLLLLVFAGCFSSRQHEEEPNMRHITNAIGRNVVVMHENDNNYCSGVILQTNQVLSIGHCYPEKKGTIIKVNGIDAEVSRVSRTHNLMLLRTETGPFEPLVIGTEPHIADKVFSVSNHNPYKGVVSIGRIMHLDKTTIKTDLFAAPGVAGSGLYDKKGRLIGINSTLNYFKNDEMATILFCQSVPGEIIKQFLEDKP